MLPGVHHCRQQDVSEPVNAEAAKVILSEIQLEPAPEIPDSSCKLVSSQCCD